MPAMGLPEVHSRERQRRGQPLLVLGYAVYKALKMPQRRGRRALRPAFYTRVWWSAHASSSRCARSSTGFACCLRLHARKPAAAAHKPATVQISFFIRCFPQEQDVGETVFRRFACGGLDAQQPERAVPLCGIRGTPWHTRPGGPATLEPWTRFASDERSATAPGTLPGRWRPSRKRLPRPIHVRPAGRSQRQRAAICRAHP